MSTQAKSADTAVTLAQARDLYAEQSPHKQGTVDTYLTGVDRFLEWAREQGHEHVADLSKLSVGGFRNWLREQSIKNYTASTYVYGARDFLKFLDSRGVLREPDMWDAIDPISVKQHEKRSDEKIEIERVDGILDYLKRYFPRHRDTIIMRIFAETGCRKCELHAVDLDDVKVNGGAPIIHLRDREGTTLKRGAEYKYNNHERDISISMSLHDAIREFVSEHRFDRVDHCNGKLCGEGRKCAGRCSRAGREPLITTRNGRMSLGSLEDTVYKWTCPKHTDTGSCECTEKPSVNDASDCNMSVGPHAYGRKSFITRAMNRGANLTDVSEQVGASPEVIRLHYDLGDASEREQRGRRAVEAAFGDESAD